MARSGSKVYLTNGYPTEVQVPTLDDEDDEQQSTTINNRMAVKVYVNGMKIANPGTYLDEYGSVRLSDPRSMYSIMPNETRGQTIYSNSNTYLKVWADYYKYSYVQRGVRVYLTNNSFVPLEVHIGWDIVDFPDQQPYVLSGRTMVPVRGLAESSGWKVDYNNSKVTISNGSHTVILFIGSKSYTLDGKEKALDVPAQIVNGRTMVPIRFIGEAFGYTVKYDGSGVVKVVNLTKT